MVPTANWVVTKRPNWSDPRKNIAAAQPQPRAKTASARAHTAEVHLTRTASHPAKKSKKIPKANQIFALGKSNSIFMGGAKLRLRNRKCLVSWP